MSDESIPDGPFVPTASDMAVDLLAEQTAVEYAIGQAKTASPLDANRLARLEVIRAVIRRAHYYEWLHAQQVDVEGVAAELGGAE